MHVELFPLDDPERLVAVIRWDGQKGHLEPVGDPLPGLDAILRPTPVMLDDPSFRRAGTFGPTVLQPGDYDWFRAAVLSRTPAMGLGARFVPDALEGGWDPAAAYRTFEQQVERITRPPVAS